MLRQIILKIKQAIIRQPLFVFVPAAFFIWFLIFKDFWLGTYALIDDSAIYYEHVRYFLENISRGVYPLWKIAGVHSVPNEFYLRRMGDFNPFYYLILIPYKVFHWPFIVSYLSFLGIYYFAGVLAFFGIAHRVLNNDIRASFTAFLLLLFSSFNTFIYSSFIVLIFTPMMWFFYFVLSFWDKPSRHALAGMVFCLMILATTYIPFYFLVIAFVVGSFALMFFSQRLGPFALRWRDFSKHNRGWTFFFLAVLVLSCVPGFLFHQETKLGYLELTTRHFNAPSEEFLQVPMQKAKFGGIVPHLVLDEFVFDVRQIQISQIYIPGFVYFLFLLGFLVKTDKKLLCLFLSGLTFFVLAIYDSPVYQFLYKHVFIFKYFRNYQFFFWLAVLPLFILLVSEHFRKFIQPGADFSGKILRGAGLLLIHLAVLFLLLKRSGTVATTYAVIAGSFLFLYCVDKIRERTVVLFFILCLVAIEPVEVYRYLKDNTVQYFREFYYGENLSYLNFTLPLKKDLAEEKKAGEGLDFSSDQIPRQYFGTIWSVEFQKKFNPDLFRGYYRSPLQLYDYVKILDLQPKDTPSIGRSLFENKNEAYVSLGQSDSPQELAAFFPMRSKVFQPIAAEPLVKDGGVIAVSQYDVNTLRFDIDLDEPKFLVWFDYFYPRWTAAINGQPAKIWRSQMCYKGIALSRGKNRVEFHYGSVMDYALKYAMSAVFISVLFLFFVFSLKEIDPKAFLEKS